MGSANLEAAVSTAVTARMLNSGQSCIAAKRFILHNSIAEEFERRFLAKLKALTVGDPLSPESDLGPLATSSIRDELHQQVQRLLKQGAQLRLGGELPAGPGNFYPPTLISDIPSGSLADEEEFFGPVALLFRVSTIDEAIRLSEPRPLWLRGQCLDDGCPRTATIHQRIGGWGCVYQ